MDRREFMQGMAAAAASTVLPVALAAAPLYTASPIDPNWLSREWWLEDILRDMASTFGIVAPGTPGYVFAEVLADCNVETYRNMNSLMEGFGITASPVPAPP